MCATSLKKGSALQFHTGLADRRFPVFRASVVAAMIFSFGTASALAASSLVANEDQAQLKADRTALASEIARLRSDERILRVDAMAGKMAAESRDSDRVYLDQQAIGGQKIAIAADKPGSLQRKTDEAALGREESQLVADLEALKSDTKSGRMAAMSPDAETVYKDQLNIGGERKDVAADMARLKADRRS